MTILPQKLQKLPFGISQKFVLSLGLILASCDSKGGPSVPLYSGLGDYQMVIATQSEEAQKYFKQGLVFFYGYNYPEATRAFLAAAACDPNSGICYWGAAVSLGECIDYPGDKWFLKSCDCMEKAKGYLEQAPELEQDLIHSLLGCKEKSEAISEIEFVSRMKKLHWKYPDNPDIAAIYANACMQQVNMAENMEDGHPTGVAKEIVDALEQGLTKYPFHPGLLHFYIHAMENCRTSEKALEAAEKLDGLVPVSGHLQHMPAHIYAHVGRYHDASRANRNGIEADNLLFNNGGVKDPEFAGFYLHNYYYFFHSLSMEGRSQEALGESRKVIERLLTGELPSNSYINNVFKSIPFLLMARFGMWEEAERESVEEDLLFAYGISQYVKGLAAFKRGDLRRSESHLERLEGARSEGAEETDFDKNLLNIMEMASLDLEGRIATPKQIENLQKALSIEQTMSLGMLPWYTPIRHLLGEALLDAGRVEEAEATFLDDLKEHPHNGWALSGLVKSLRAQHRYHEAAEKEKEFDEAWKYADFATSTF